MQRIDNQQDYNLNLELTNNQIQVLLTGTFGDGCIKQNKSGTSTFTSSSIYEEYINYKNNLLGSLFSSYHSTTNRGFKNNIIFRNLSIASSRITKFHNLSLEDKLSLFTDLGLALWFYDDGSLHKKNHFFNLNTHSFNEEIHRDLLVPFFNNLGMKPDVYKDRKKDGREFCYLYFAKHFGAYEIMKILEKYPIDCFKYKLWSSETIQNWSKLKAELKSRGIENISPRKFTNILLEKSSIQDIVPSHKKL